MKKCLCFLALCMCPAAFAGQISVLYNNYTSHSSLSQSVYGNFASVGTQPPGVSSIPLLANIYGSWTFIYEDSFLSSASVYYSVNYTVTWTESTAGEGLPANLYVNLNTISLLKGLVQLHEGSDAFAFQTSGTLADNVSTASPGSSLIGTSASLSGGGTNASGGSVSVIGGGTSSQSNISITPTWTLKGAIAGGRKVWTTPASVVSPTAEVSNADIAVLYRGADPLTGYISAYSTLTEAVHFHV